MFTGKIIVNSQASNTIYNDTTNSMATKDSTTHFAPELHIPNGTHNIDFFFSSRRRHTRCGRDWSSDVCSSDLYGGDQLGYVENFLKMMFKKPNGEFNSNPVITKALDKLLILHADHEQNCSTSTVRIVGSSHAGLFISRSEERRVGKECVYGWWR